MPHHTIKTFQCSGTRNVDFLRGILDQKEQTPGAAYKELKIFNVLGLKLMPRKNFQRKAIT